MYLVGPDVYQQARNLKTTSYKRRCDVMTSIRRCFDVMCPVELISFRSGTSSTSVLLEFKENERSVKALRLYRLARDFSDSLCERPVSKKAGLHNCTSRNF